MTIALHFGAQHRSKKLVDLICVSLRSTRMPIAVGVEHTDGGNEQPFLHGVSVGLHLWGSPRASAMAWAVVVTMATGGLGVSTK